MSFSDILEQWKQQLRQIEKEMSLAWKEFDDASLEYESEKMTWPKLKEKYSSLFDVFRSGIPKIKLFSPRAGEHLEKELNQLQDIFHQYVETYEKDFVFLKWSKNQKKLSIIKNNFHTRIGKFVIAWKMSIYCVNDMITKVENNYKNP